MSFLSASHTSGRRRTSCGRHAPGHIYYLYIRKTQALTLSCFFLKVVKDCISPALMLRNMAKNRHCHSAGCKPGLRPPAEERKETAS